MKVKDLVELLLRSPQDNTLIVEMVTDGEDHTAELADEPPMFDIDDVMVGTGTLRGLTYIELLEDK